MLVRRKENSKECRNSRYEQQPLNWAETGRRGRAPPAPGSAPDCWSGHRCSGELAVERAGNLPSRIFPLWGKLFMRRFLIGGPLIQNCLRRCRGSHRLWVLLPALEDLGTCAAGCWRSPVPSALSLQHPLLTTFNASG